MKSSTSFPSLQRHQLLLGMSSCCLLYLLLLTDLLKLSDAVSAPPSPQHFNDENYSGFRESKDIVIGTIEAERGSQTLTSTRQKDVWEFFADAEKYKADSPLYSGSEGELTLTSFHYIVLPIWWSDEDINDPDLLIDRDHLGDIMQQSRDYYKDMSWGKMDITFEIMDQKLFPVSSKSPTATDVVHEAKNMVAEAGYVEHVNHNGIVLASFPSQDGPYSNAWGRAGVNDNHMWIRYPFYFYTARHEIGHNFGHWHHLSVSYTYRDTRPDIGEYIAPRDGFDMMSGSAYANSDFAAASKWFFNWIPDESIILMQPEGSTTECPSCSNSGTFILKAFDDRNTAPSQSNKMAIHIPIARNQDTLYSYWLTYRGSGVGGTAAGGLSIHLSWFTLYGIFGASYDSMNYDAFGDTFGTFDSFVIEDTCYPIAPAGYMKDIIPLNSYAVMPVVCVDSIDVGSSITVSVSFQPDSNTSLEPTSNVVDLACSTSGTSLTQTFSGDTEYLVHVTNTGSVGIITLDMCIDTITSTSDLSKAYFYDDFPASPVIYESEPAYGSFKSLVTSSFECCDPGSTIPVTGGKVVKVKQNACCENDGWSFLHLNEIEIYDTSGKNVALDGKCFSSDSPWGGDPNCLNDGLVGPNNETCSSYSYSTGPDVYDYCVLDDAIEIDRIVIFPFVNDPEFPWETSRLTNLSVEVFAEISGQGVDAMFTGLLYSYDLIDVFNLQNTDPHEEYIPPLPETMDCPNTIQSPVHTLNYTSDFGETYLFFPASNSATSIELSCKVTKDNPCRQRHQLVDLKWVIDLFF